MRVKRRADACSESCECVYIELLRIAFMHHMQLCIHAFVTRICV
jgi:hypothetical protein